MTYQTRDFYWVVEFKDGKRWYVITLPTGEYETHDKKEASEHYETVLKNTRYRGFDIRLISVEKKVYRIRKRLDNR